MVPRAEVPGPKFHAHAHLHLMGSPHAHTGHIDIYLGHRSVHKIPELKVIAPRSKVTGPKFYAHAQLHLNSSPHAQAGDTGINTFGTGASTIFPS